MDLNGVGLKVIWVGVPLDGGVVQDEGGGQVVICGKDGFRGGRDRVNGENQVIDGEAIGTRGLGGYGQPSSGVYFPSGGFPAIDCHCGANKQDEFTMLEEDMGGNRT